MEGECKVELDTMVATEPGKQSSQGFRLSSKLTTALLTFTLCLAAALIIFDRHAKVSGQDKDKNGDDLRHTLRQISNVRAAIHLEGEYNPNRTDSVEWKAQVDQAHSQGGLQLNDNEIVIPQDGLYFVYSQASFRVSCSSDNKDMTSNPMVHLSHTVKRWSSLFGNDKSEESYHTILYSARTACQKTVSSDSNDESWFSAVYMGAAFNLKKGDQLKTVMEENMLKKLEDEPGKTFFGVFAL
ncbi:tumor necrosis factor a (TNF superfamily, member 2) [Mugil cephalus]|uniref:tumor necrosis factor a (TNF superfamily, member 2) n=1 Tax=Mugil cephalus TaxID=48193 RepID=UPI001FB69885|nr:tumor necrosis factor a (TNF superfamily, member 2) [Mugil cephalus]